MWRRKLGGEYAKIVFLARESLFAFVLMNMHD